MKQVYKNKVYTRRKCINSIVRFYNEALESEIRAGMNWYIEVNELAKEFSLKTGYSIMQISGVIAALSPQTSWELNKVYLVRFLKDGIKATSNTHLNKIKAEKCLKATNVEQIKRILKGNKTKSFFFNIAFPDVDKIATIDRHAMAICLQNPQKVNAIKEPVQLTTIQYNFFESCYVQAAEKLGLKTLELQAATWIVYRRLRNLK
jgi:hypothetical protein